MGLKLCCISKREALAKKAGTPPEKHPRIFVDEYDCSLFQGQIENGVDVYIFIMINYCMLDMKTGSACCEKKTLING